MNQSCRWFTRRGPDRLIYPTSISMTYLPDVNVWISLAAERHVHDRRAAT